MPSRFLEIARRKIAARDLELREGLLNRTQEPPCAACDIEQPAAPLIAPAEKLEDRHEALPAHGIGAARKQDLDLHVVEPRRLFGQISAGLVMEVLQEVG